MLRGCVERVHYKVCEILARPPGVKEWVREGVSVGWVERVCQ